MRIALIGAPGSGKTALAGDLLENLVFDREPRPNSVAIIDHYVDDIENDYSIACGAAGTYITNTMIIASRLAREHKANADNDHTITCGTLIDTAAYELVNADIAGQQNIAMRAYNLMHVISTLIIDTWKYDHVFYLPLRDSEREFYKSLDVAIPEILAQTQCEHHAIVSDNQLEAALEVINADANVSV